jgi:hypothetical protein
VRRYQRLAGLGHVGDAAMCTAMQPMSSRFSSISPV